MKFPQQPEILFEDDHLVALTKPAGLPTAQAESGQESVYTLLQRRPPDRALTRAKPFVGIVSRLDAPVSGILVTAKTPAAAASLAAQFRMHEVEKTYFAIVTGRFPGALAAWVEWNDVTWRSADETRTRLSPTRAAGDIGSSPAVQPGLNALPPADARSAHARARVVTRAGEVSLVELVPSTGRRHQLRAQLAARGCPIVGDRRYGSRLPSLGPGIALHAASLVFTHPADGRRMAFDAPVPEIWQARFPSLFR